MSQPIDRSEVLAFFTALQRRQSPLAFWSYDTSNGEQRLVEGYVAAASLTLLDIEDFDHEHTFVVLAGVNFVQLEREDAPEQIRAVAKDSYDFVLGFPAGKYACCIMAEDVRDKAASE